MACIYLIKSLKQKNWIYAGSTEDIKERLRKHNAGGVRSTRSRRPFVLIYKEEHATIEAARKREREIKKSRHKKSELIKMALSSSLV